MTDKINISLFFLLRAIFFAVSLNIAKNISIPQSKYKFSIFNQNYTYQLNYRKRFLKIQLLLSFFERLH